MEATVQASSIAVCSASRSRHRGQYPGSGWGSTLFGCGWVLQFEDVRLKVELKANSSWLPSEWGAIAACFAPKKRQPTDKQVS